MKSFLPSWMSFGKRAPHAEAESVSPLEVESLSTKAQSTSSDEGPSAPFKGFTDRERRALGDRRCPDCGGAEFYQGPSGGMTTNVMCAGANCGSRFNVGEFGGAVLGERISEPQPLKV